MELRGGARRISWARYQLALVLVVYLASRLFGLSSLAPSNDEIIFTQYAQLMAEDWQEFRYCSVDGRFYGDYKDPLQFWCGSLTVNAFANPLIGVRLWSLLCGALGLVFSYLLVARLWSRRAALLTAGFIVLSDHFLYFDSTAVIEVWVYGLGALYLYLALRALEAAGPRWLYFLLSSLCMAAMLVAKLSASIWLGLGLVLPLLPAAARGVREGTKDARLRRWAVDSLLLVVGYLVARYLLYPLCVPPRFAAARGQGTAWFVLRPEQLWQFPWRLWLKNLGFYFGTVLTGELGWARFPLALAVIVAVPLAIRRRKQRVLLVGFLLWLGSFLPMVLVLGKPFARHFGMGLYFAYLLAGCALALLGEGLPRGRLRNLAALVLVSLLLANKVPSYLEIGADGLHAYASRDAEGWANGAGITRLVDRIALLPPGTMLLDPQWGLPGTAIQVFAASRYSQMRLRLIQPGNVARQIEEARAAGAAVYAVIDSGRAEREALAGLLQTEAGGRPVQHIDKSFAGQTLPGTRLSIYRLQ